MFDRADLRAAVEAGAISDEGARRLEAFLKSRSDPARMLDPENLRFLANFNDIFLTIGLGVLLTGVSFLSGILLSEAMGLTRWTVALAPVPVLVSAWLLAEYFCGQRRLLLPSMALAGAIVVSTAMIAGALLAPEEDANMLGQGVENVLATLSFAAFGAGALAALAVFIRFRLPFALFLLALTIAGVFYTAVARFVDGDLLVGGAATLAAGIITLLTAIWYDARDPQRASLSSDCAFWLHMAAAPQIMFGLRGLILGSGFAPAGMADATVMLLALLVFGLLSLALNRRALIVSGLLSFAASLWVLVDSVGGGGLNTLMLTALIVGGCIVLLGGGWRTARRALLRPLPATGWSARIFPPEPA